MNSYIETAISLILIFFIFSVIAYVIQEIIAVNLQYRGKVLWKSLSHIFDGAKAKGRDFLRKPVEANASPNTAAFYGHAQIASLKKNADRLPAYIPAANFALAVIDSIAEKAGAGAAGKTMLAKVQAGLDEFAASDGDLFKVVKNLADTSTDVKELQQKLEAWFNEYMDRVTGWYKSHIVLTTRLIALGVTLFFNVDVINISKEIYNNADLRGKLVAVAEKVTEHPETVTKYYTEGFTQEVAAIDTLFQPRLDSAKDDAQKAAIVKEMNVLKRDAADSFTKRRLAAIDSLSRNLSSAGLPLGWRGSFVDKYFSKDSNAGFWAYVWLFLGWLIAAGCIAMGAPFWFDLLVKAVNVRRAGVKPSASDSKRQ